MSLKKAGKIQTGENEREMGREEVTARTQVRVNKIKMGKL